MMMMMMTMMIQSLSETRWSVRSDACKALVENYVEVKNTLLDFTASGRQTLSAVNKATPLHKKLDQLETAVIGPMCVVWNDILQKANIVSKTLQQAGIEICTIVKLYDSLIAYFTEIRDHFDDFESKAKMLVSVGYAEARA